MLGLHKWSYFAGHTGNDYCNGTVRMWVADGGGEPWWTVAVWGMVH